MNRRVVALALASGIAASSCGGGTTATPLDRGVDPAKVAPSQGRRLVLDETQSGEIMCEEGFCEQWYRLDVPWPGMLRIEVTSAVADPPMARILRHDGLGTVLARANNQNGQLKIAYPVQGNVAAILLQSGKGRFPYSLTARLD